MDDRTITIGLEDGTELLCDILFTYFSADFEKNYVVFRVKSTGEISAASYTEVDGKTGEISKIDSDEEWEMLEDMLADYFENQNCEGDCSSCGGCKRSDEE